MQKGTREKSKKPTESRLRTTRLFELSITTDSFPKIFEFLTTQVPQDAVQKRPLLVATPNPEQVVLSQKNPTFQRTLQSMDVLLPDGSGLVLASRILAAAGKAVPISSRVTGVDLVQALLAVATQTHKTVLVIGGRGYESIGRPAKRFIKQKVMLLDIPGIHDSVSCYWLEGYAAAQKPTPEEEIQVEQVIRTLKPAYVFIALGAPLQEQWLLAHQDLLQKNNAQLAMAVGGAFDMLTGKLDRAPKLLQQLQLEWLYRLYQEPWRWRRQLSLFEFMKLTVQEVLS